MNKRFLQSVTEGRTDSVNSPLFVALPAELIAFLEQAAEDRLDSESFQTWYLELHELMTEKARYILHSAAEDSFNEALLQWDLLGQHLTQVDVGQAVEASLLLFRSLHRLEMMSEANRQSSLPGVNRLLLCALSYVEGRVDAATVADLVDGAVSDLDRLVELYQGEEDHLPEAVKDACLLGIERSGAAIAAFREWDHSDLRVLKTALEGLTDGARLLGSLQTLKDQSDAEAVGSIPLVGEVVHRMLGQLERAGTLTESALDSWSSRDFGQLTHFWDEAKTGLLLSSRHRRSLIHEIDSQLTLLSDLRALPPAAQRSALGQLDDLFSRLAHYQLDIKRLDGHPERWRGDLILAILAKGIPDFYLRTAVNDLNQRGDIELAEGIKSYLSTGQEDALVGLLERELSGAESR
jgi:hypothetical protein